MFDFSFPVVLWLSLVPSFYSLAGLGLCQDPAGPSLSAVSSNSSIVSATSNEMQKVVVIPKTQNNIQQIQQSIDTTIKTGHAKIVESKHMSGYNGVLLWSVNAEKMEIDVLRQKLGNLVSVFFEKLPLNVMCSRLTANGEQG